MKQLVLMNKETGELGLGIRINWFGHPDDIKLASMEGYSVMLSCELDCDAWLLFTGAMDKNEPWNFIKKEFLENKCEVLCEL